MRTGIAVALVSLVGLAHADPKDDPERKRADALFEEAKALIDAGQLEAGCAKFEESLTHDKNAIGTILNIAKCQARLGKIATAYTTYVDVRDRAKLQNAPEYGQLADDSIAQLAPFVPHLAITLADRTLTGLEVSVDDKPVGLDAIADVLLDPGAHVVTVRAPHHEPYSERLTIAKREHRAMSVPPLVARGKASPIPMIVTASGGGLVLTGIVIGLVARTHYNDAIANECNGNRMTCTDGGAAANDARTLGTVGTVIGVTGLLAAGAGAYLWLTHRHDGDESITVAPAIGHDQAGVFAFGRF